MLSLAGEVIVMSDTTLKSCSDSFIKYLFSHLASIYVTFIPRDTDKNKVTTLLGLILN